MPTKKYKYHFLTVKETAYGKIVTALPGQKIGRSELHTDVVVRDRKGSTLVERTKKSTPAGVILFTTTLKNKISYYEASDIYRLDGIEDITMANAIEQYEKLINK